ncbi:hypothetical protein FGO68_gene5584 [Halteria grandinella]|uniref:Uncharacterized protein n=1 Tax=Halteria grandinella TaxID=5974 RepID=A0A8J8P8S8_HALGN|nr:hypothetical protein FGO68_gene5584 [Halteria grandinella]
MNKDLFGLTSSHHMALEAAIRRIKVILQEKREERKTLAEMASANNNNLAGMEMVSRSENLPFRSAFDRDSRPDSSGNSPAGNRLLSGFGKAMKKSLQIKSGGVSLHQGFDRLTNLLINEQERKGGTQTGLLTPADIISMASKRLEIFKHKSSHTVAQGKAPSGSGST